MSRATDSKSHRKTHSENHLRRDLQQQRGGGGGESRAEQQRGGGGGEDHGQCLEEFSWHCPHRRTDTVAIIYKIP